MIASRINNLFFLLLFSISSNFLFAQESFIVSNTSIYNQLSSQGKITFDNLQNNQKFSNASLVEISNFYSLISDGKLEISHPFIDCEDLEFQTESINYVNEQNYSYSGSTQYQLGYSCGIGEIYLQRTGIDLRGILRLSGHYFTFFNIENKIVFAKLINAQLHGGCGAIESSFINEDFNLPFTSVEIPYCPIDILVLYDPSISYLGSVPLSSQEDFELETRLNSGILRMALDRSNLSRIRYDIIDVRESPMPITPSTDPSTYVNNLASNQTILNLKDETNADIVILYVAEGSMTGATGVVQNILALNKEDAFALVDVSTSSRTTGTFAHEVAHILGAGHFFEDPLNPFVTEYAKAFRFDSPNSSGQTYTIMGLPQLSNDDDLLQFSNPSVFFENEQTGIDDENDNARIMKTFACRISQLEDPLESLPPSFNLMAPATSCPCVSFETSFDGNGTFSNFRWLTSLNGVDFIINNSSSGSTINLNASCEIGGKLFIRLIAENSSGVDEVFETSIRSVATNQLSSPCGLKEINPIISNTMSGVVLFPNPTDRSINLKYYNLDRESNNAFEYIIRDINGRVIAVNSRNRTGLNGVNINIADLLDGVYEIVILDSTGAIYEVKRFVKL